MGDTKNLHSPKPHHENNSFPFLSVGLTDLFHIIDLSRRSKCWLARRCCGETFWGKRADYIPHINSRSKAYREISTPWTVLLAQTLKYRLIYIFSTHLISKSHDFRESSLDRLKYPEH